MPKIRWGSSIWSPNLGGGGLQGHRSIFERVHLRNNKHSADSNSTFLQRQKKFVKNFCQSYQMYQNVRAFMLFILTYWYLKSVDPFKSCDGFFKDLQNRRFCEKFWVNRLFWIAKIILSKFFVRGTKYTKMFGSSCSLFWHIDIENLLIRLKAVMVSLKTSETEDFYHKIGKSIFFNNKELCGEKSLWQSFENQKSESTVLLYFTLAFSWCTIL